MQMIKYQADGLEMHSELYKPEELEPRPGVLVFPEALGISDHSREKAQRLTDLGYIALVCDIHGNGLFEPDIQKLGPLIGPLHQDPMKTRARAQGGLDALLAQKGVDGTRIAAIGFCFGGSIALELARSGAPISALAGFHCTLRTQRPEGAANIKAKVLIAIGADDPMVDAAQRTAFEEEMRAGNVDWQMHLYGGVVHSFTNKAADQANRPDTIRYSASADARSWKAMSALFDEVFA